MILSQQNHIGFRQAASTHELQKQHGKNQRVIGKQCQGAQRQDMHAVVHAAELLV